MLGRTSKILAILVIAFGVALMTPSNAFCQIGGGGGGGGVGGGGGNGGGGNGGGDDGGDDNNENGNQNFGGIEISAGGVIQNKVRVGNVAALNRLRFANAQQSLNKDLQTPSKMRKISLTRLEREVEKLVAEGKQVPADMRYLAGMTKITHVFFYPESNDIVIAGPAEGYFLNADNYVVGMQTGRATLQLQDLIVALRAFGPNGNSPKLISCSIDPTQEGLVKFRQTHQQIADSGQFRPGLEGQVLQLYKQSLGMQQISIDGISKKTNFARILVEADYEMKMIGIGLAEPADRGVVSFISQAQPGGNSLQRWFFQPDYDCVNVNQDRTAMELVGNGVKLVGEDESVTANGDRKGTGKMSRASRAYTTSFTKNYSKMAAKDPIWAELENVIDLSVVAAFIQKMGLYEKAGWEMATFGDEAIVAVENFEEPTQVAPVANAVWKNGMFMAPIAGGVSIQPKVAFNSDRMKVDENGSIDKVRDEITLDGLEDGQWWWD